MLYIYNPVIPSGLIVSIVTKSLRYLKTTPPDLIPIGQLLKSKLHYRSFKLCICNIGIKRTFFTKNNKTFTNANIFNHFDYICVMRNSNKILDEIVRMANSKYPDAEIYLYGSRARGDSKRISDWDLLILLNRPNIPFDVETKVMDDFYDVELETGVVISPLIYSKSDWNERYSMTPLFENIKKEGIRIK